MSDNDYVYQRSLKAFEELDFQIVQAAALCEIRILDPGMIERVLHNETGICGNDKLGAFEKLRALVMIHYTMRDKAVAEMGQEQTMKVMDEVLERLRARCGDALGNPAA
jgi:hypothetical protein